MENTVEWSIGQRLKKTEVETIMLRPAPDSCFVCLEVSDPVKVVIK